MASDLTQLRPMFPFYIPENIRKVSFLYPLKTSENQRFSDVFRGYRNEKFSNVFRYIKRAHWSEMDQLVGR